MGRPFMVPSRPVPYRSDHLPSHHSSINLPPLTARSRDPRDHPWIGPNPEHSYQDTPLWHRANAQKHYIEASVQRSRVDNQLPVIPNRSYEEDALSFDSKTYGPKSWVPNPEYWVPAVQTALQTAGHYVPHAAAAALALGAAYKGYQWYTSSSSRPSEQSRPRRPYYRKRYRSR